MSRLGLMLVLGLSMLGGCGGAKAPVRSLTGEPLPPLELPARTIDMQQTKLAEARRDYDADPTDEMNIIWYGRRLAYLGQYREAIDIFTRGLQIHADSHRLLRHRGHRYITVRDLASAERDLSRAAQLVESRGIPDETEPDGLPNAINQPRSTTNSNIYYHLGLARYLLGRYEDALDAYQRGMTYAAVNDDTQVAMVYWTYLTLRKLERNDAAKDVLAEIGPRLHIIENHDYHRLLRLYQGAMTQDDLLSEAGAEALSSATTMYGLGAWHLAEHRPEEAAAFLHRAIETGFWPAFGYIAAEAELARHPGLRRPDARPGGSASPKSDPVRETLRRQRDTAAR